MLAVDGISSTGEQGGLPHVSFVGGEKFLRFTLYSRVHCLMCLLLRLIKATLSKSVHLWSITGPECWNQLLCDILFFILTGEPSAFSFFQGHSLILGFWHWKRL